MSEHTFFIKSLHVQNMIMLFSLAVVVFFLIRSLVLKKPRHILAFAIWVFIVLWFFNSPFFGFSAVTVGPQGVQIEYGVLSLRNERLSLGTGWKIEDHAAGIRRLRKLYSLRIGGHRSMKVKSGEGLTLLKKIGRSIDEARLGKEETPVGGKK